jgi:hypothetical protein
MGRKLEVDPVEPRLVPVGAIDPDLGIVGYELRRYATYESERADMRANPVVSSSPSA